MDLIYVTYRSEKWIDTCFHSILKTNYDLTRLYITVIDNCSDDGTVECLEKIKTELDGIVGRFQIIRTEVNWGFGKANNIAFQCGHEDIVAFINIDTEMHSDTLEVLEKSIISSPSNTGAWELRQLPYEHPKLYNPITMETDWCSGAALVVRRKAFEQIGGFDEKIFMYAEDVDLSWRLRQRGYKLLYVPKAVISHYTYTSEGEIKPYQYIYSIINNLYLRKKFGRFSDVLLGQLMFWNIMRHKAKFHGAKKWLMSEYLKMKIKKNVQSQSTSDLFQPYFSGFDYSINRDGAYYPTALPLQGPLVSIIVRTCGRPDVLRETLKSLANQTYPHFEIVLVEDGVESASEMAAKEFKDLNIIYKSTGTRVGRSKVGNLGMELAHGKYLNFLDDDDLFFADHIETLTAALLSSPHKLAYSLAFETPIEVISQKPYIYKIHSYNKTHTQSYDKIELCHHNYLPIQCVMFEKTLFEKYGGFDESLEALEDWDLWVRYSLYTDFQFVPKTTSVYRIPYDKAVNSDRQKKLDEALITVRNKHKGYVQQLSVYEIAKLYENAH